MNIEDMKIYLKKDVKIVLKNQFTYSGSIDTVGEDSFRFKDKYGQILIFALDQVSAILPLEKKDVESN